MSMFCYQCQETAGCKGCTKVGVCGKDEHVAKAQDLLIYVTKGLAIVSNEGRKIGVKDAKVDKFIVENLFTTITNANFDRDSILDRIRETLKIREELKVKVVKAGGVVGEVKVQGGFLRKYLGYKLKKWLCRMQQLGQLII